MNTYGLESGIDSWDHLPWDSWEGWAKSFKFSPDYMAERNQPPQQARGPIFD